MDLGLRDASCVVLASTSGLGRGVAEALLREGARVVVSGRDPARLERALEELAGLGGTVLGEALDVTDASALEAHLERAAAAHGPVEVLVTNAAGPPAGGAAGLGDAELEAAFRATVLSAVRAVRAVLPGMRARGHGRIVALTSSSVRVPIPELALSNVARPALTAWLKTLAGEVARDGVTVNSICTGSFDTPRLEGLLALRARERGTTLEEERARHLAAIPAGRLGRLDEFGDLVAFLASRRASYLTGLALAHDGGANPALL